jgi:hypothetical protein
MGGSTSSSAATLDREHGTRSLGKPRILPRTEHSKRARRLLARDHYSFPDQRDPRLNEAEPPKERMQAQPPTLDATSAATVEREPL